MAANYALLQALLGARGDEAEGDEGTMKVQLNGAPAENRSYIEEPPQVTVTRTPQTYSGAGLMTADEPEPKKGKGFNWGRAMWAMGGGSLADYDAKGNADRNHELAKQREERMNRRSDFDLEQEKSAAPYKLQALKDDGETKAQKLSESRAEIDPSSPYSQVMRGGVATQMQSMGSALAQRGDQAGAKIYLDAANMIQNNNQLSVPQLLKAAETLGVGAQFNLKALHDQATEAQSNARLGVDQTQAAQGWARINDSKEDRADRREERQLTRDQVTQRRADEHADKQAQLMPPGSQSNEYLDRMEAEKKIARAKELVSKGDIRMMGKGAKALNGLMSTLPDAVDIRNKDERELASLLSWIAAPERKELFGSSLTGGEQTASDELFASIGKNKATVMQSLEHMGGQAKTKNEQLRKLYPGLNKADAPAAAPKKAATRATQQAPAGKIVIQNGYRYQQQPDGSYKAIGKAQ